MFSHLDAAFRSLDTDQGALLQVLTLERAGPRHFGEIPVRAGDYQEASAAFLTLLHSNVEGEDDRQHLLLLQKGLSLGVLMLHVLSPLIVMRSAWEGNTQEASALARTTPALLRYRKRKKNI